MNTLKYYQTNYRRIFNSIKDSRWRIWKIIDHDDRTIQSKFPITKPEDLWKFIKQAEKPKALYVSVSTFLNSHLNHGAFYRQNFRLSDGTNMFPREGYIISDNIMLDTNLFIDLDEEDLRIAQEDGKKIIVYMENKSEYRLNMLQFSGTRGIHLGYEFLNKPQIKDPIKRIEHYKAVKGRLAKELLKLGLKTIDRHHIEIIKNNFCVFAAPYSLKSNGNIVTPIHQTDFMQKDIYDILRFFKSTRALKCRNKASEIPKGIDDEKVAFAEGNTLASHKYRTGGRLTGLSSQPIYFKFIDNMINGLKNTYITVIKKHTKRFKVKDLKDLQKKRNLSDFYIVRIGNFVYSYNCKIMDFDGEVKILRKAKSRNLSYFITRRHLPIQITPSFYENGETADEIEYIGTLKSKFGTYDNHSKSHSKLFGLNYENLVGNENNVGVMRVS